MRGSMLKEILQEQGISISELARRLNVSAQTLYSMVKRDNQKVDFDMMMHICKLLNVISLPIILWQVDRVFDVWVILNHKL